MKKYHKKLRFLINVHVSLTLNDHKAKAAMTTADYCIQVAHGKTISLSLPWDKVL